MDITLPKIVGIACGLMLGIVVVQAVMPQPAPPVAPPTPPAGSCIGEPIHVEYAYSGWLEPHACAVQCDDDEPRYILYADGKATQCQTPPGCNDEGEDRGILCEPVLTSQ